MAKGGSEERCHLTITCRIENIRRLETENEWFTTCSSVFRSHSLGRKKLQLYLNPKASCGSRNIVSLQLYLWDDPLDFPIDCEWSFVGVNGSTIFSGAKRNCVLVRDRYFPLPGCPTHEDVFVTKQSEVLFHDTLTVRCRIWKSREDVLHEEFISCRTRIESLEHSFLWPISGFSSLELNRKVTIPVTFGDSGAKDNFLMKFSLKGASLEGARVNVELSPATISNPLIAALKLTVMDKEQKVVKRGEKKYFLFTKYGKQILKFPYFVSRNELLEDKSDCLKDDILNLLCEIPLIKFTRSIETSYYGFPNLKLELLKKSSTPSKASTAFVESSTLSASNCKTTKTDISFQGMCSVSCLVEDLQSLYSDQNQTDFELKSGDVSFNVHKIILSVRSPVFKTMFSSDMMESGSDSLEVPDLDSHTLNRFLTFLYTGTLEQDLQWENAAKLYYAATKYEVQSLKQHCSCILRSQISASNVSDILSLADRQQDKELTSFVHDFILSRFSEIMHSKEWKIFMDCDPALAGKTTLELYTKKESNELELIHGPPKLN